MYYYLFLRYLYFQVFFVCSLFFSDDFLFFNFFFRDRHRLLNSFLIKERKNRFKGRSRSIVMLKLDKLVKEFLNTLPVKDVVSEIRITNNYTYLSKKRGRGLRRLYKKFTGMINSKKWFFPRRYFYLHHDFKLFSQIRLLRRRRKRLLLKRLRFSFKIRKLMIVRIKKKYRGPFTFKEVFSFCGFLPMYDNISRRFRKNIIKFNRGKISKKSLTDIFTLLTIYKQNKKKN